MGRTPEYDYPETRQKRVSLRELGLKKQTKSALYHPQHPFKRLPSLTFDDLNCETNTAARMRSSADDVINHVLFAMLNLPRPHPIHRSALSSSSFPHLSISSPNSQPRMPRLPQLSQRRRLEQPKPRHHPAHQRQADRHRHQRPVGRPPRSGEGESSEGGGG